METKVGSPGTKGNPSLTIWPWAAEKQIGETQDRDVIAVTRFRYVEGEAVVETHEFYVGTGHYSYTVDRRPARPGEIEKAESYTQGGTPEWRIGQ